MTICCLIICGGIAVVILVLHGLARFRLNEELERGTNFFLVRHGHLEESLPYVHTHTHTHTHNNAESGWEGGY